MLDDELEPIVTHHLRSVIASTILLLASFEAAAVSRPFHIVFREGVGKSDAIVVGRVIGTAPFDSTVSERLSTIVADEVVWGSVNVGDEFDVFWHAKEWYPEPGITGRFACGGWVQLSELEGVQALWILQEASGVVLDSTHRFLSRPLAFEHVDEVRVRQAIDILTEPKVSAMKPNWDGEPADMEERCEAVLVCLKEMLTGVKGP